MEDLLRYLFWSTVSIVRGRNCVFVVHPLSSERVIQRATWSPLPIGTIRESGESGGLELSTSLDNVYIYSAC